MSQALDGEHVWADGDKRCFALAQQFKDQMAILGEYIYFSGLVEFDLILTGNIAGCFVLGKK